MGGFMQSAVSILMLAVLLIQGAFGSMPGSVVICMGGGHHHEGSDHHHHHETAATCQAGPPQACCTGCSHEDSWPAPETGDHHADDCHCTDIELLLVDLQFSLRDDAVIVLRDDIGSPSETRSADWITLGGSFSTPIACAIGPPHRACPDVARAHRLAVVRTVRLQV